MYARTDNANGGKVFPKYLYPFNAKDTEHNASEPLGCGMKQVQMCVIVMFFVVVCKNW